jgi:hypothetical protein
LGGVGARQSLRFPFTFIDSMIEAPFKHHVIWRQAVSKVGAVILCAFPLCLLPAGSSWGAQLWEILNKILGLKLWIAVGLKRSPLAGRLANFILVSIISNKL